MSASPPQYSINDAGNIRLERTIGTGTGEVRHFFVGGSFQTANAAMRLLQTFEQWTLDSNKNAPPVPATIYVVLMDNGDSVSAFGSREAAEQFVWEKMSETPGTWFRTVDVCAKRYRDEWKNKNGTIKIVLRTVTVAPPFANVDMQDID